ncbi:bifunctional 2-polyprenyl-6-hydroxyphenol methylase/3-demethylubiquinol 3-O-methyltransferase UbiG [Bradyrhizobium sp. MOS002]|uniref:class I SAM-dependent methyltransferase n=1 Tax=Bradyrhizobium sp. MOS002 TaxID=2133947 RepID=UPI000D139047|nr:class I SAM-dependent methyltransferase [Bradyrhizobium sp. MOS002]PSO23653.1 hypothetical protein C7G41_32470 [Bradyrhizobium sp. MOS002]
MPHNDDLFSKSYKLFEDRFRGSEAAIRERLEVYVPLIASFGSDQGRIALDIGSGRGEWLRLLLDHGWRAVGVEPNDIAEASLTSGAEIIRSDALDFLRQCSDHSYSLVTAFHVVEHLETSYLLSVLAEIRRVLRPGGILLLETPNPENLTVSSWSFRLDPTHKAPIPPLLLQHFVQSTGFLAANITRMNGVHVEGEYGSLSTVLSTLFRSGPDYAVVACTPGGDNDDSLSHFIAVFAQGISQRNPSDIASLLQLTADADSVARQMNERVLNLEYLPDRILNLEHRCASLDRHVAERDQQLAALYNSTSWRVSAPVRFLGERSSRLLFKLKKAMRSGLERSILGLRQHRRVKRLLLGGLSRLPSLKGRLVRFSESRAPQTVWSLEVDEGKVARWKQMIKNSGPEK